MTTQIKQAPVGALNIFYREAGSPNDTVILLLHGFPSSSHQYRNLIPILSQNYRVIAPDLPGFGFTTVPDGFSYSFDSLSRVVSDFLDVIRVDKCAVYIFDYGAPVALRLALRRPALFTAIITQNGNAYEDGLGAFWEPVKKYWSTNDTLDRGALKSVLNFEATKSQYVGGARNPESIAPEGYWLDYTLLERPGNADIQLDLFKDYENNVKLYPQFQAYFRDSRVPLLAVWGKNDPIFIPAGAEAFKKDLPNAEVHLLDGGHFLLESDLEEVSSLILQFLNKNVK